MSSNSPPNPFVASPVSSPPVSPPLMAPAVASAVRKPSSLISAASGSPPPKHRASFPDPSKHPKTGATVGGPKTKSGWCCAIDKEISLGEEVHVVDAVKTTEGGTASYITYVIRIGTHTVRRRYSAFLSLHQALTGLYPVLIIPPIPSKQSIADYAVKGQSKAKEDATVIARRRRLLEDFLRRLARHPILGGEHVLHRFLEEGSEVLHSPPISLLPKNPLHAPSHNPTFQPATPTSAGDAPTSTSYIAHHLLPTPSPSHPLRSPDHRFLDSEHFTEKFQDHFAGTMEKVNRRVTKRWGERASDMSELGGIWNGFSLVEQGRLGEAVEKVGQAVDAEYLATAALVSVMFWLQLTNGKLQAWERTTTEPVHIYAQFASLIRSRLSFRHQKHVQFELVQEALETQRDKLDLLEKAEREAHRLEEALERGGSVLVNPSSVDTQEESERAQRRGRSGQGFGLLSAVKHTISGMIDMDPEATRRASIAKTRDNISQLEDSYQAAAQDLKYASATLQADLDRFQRQKVADFRQLAINLSKAHRDWCQQNLEAWQAAKAAIAEIDPHPNQRPPAESQLQVNLSMQTQQNETGADIDVISTREEIERVEAPEPSPTIKAFTHERANETESQVQDVGSGKEQIKQENDVSEHGPLGPL
ncbi:sorting nexin-41 [Cryptococcus depauperatus CBS 7841]|uniref:Sorting nexin-41 n=1 Tax=Cryptococcus depauperatus CBS 7841 TaxID=1295531 RepID=A0AAJ8JNB9_9TREE